MLSHGLFTSKADRSAYTFLFLYNTSAVSISQGLPKWQIIILMSGKSTATSSIYNGWAKRTFGWRVDAPCASAWLAPDQQSPEWNSSGIFAVSHISAIL